MLAIQRPATQNESCISEATKPFQLAVNYASSSCGLAMRFPGPLPKYKETRANRLPIIDKAVARPQKQMRNGQSHRADTLAKGAQAYDRIVPFVSANDQMWSLALPG
jgi:hypothetical protein